MDKGSGLNVRWVSSLDENNKKLEEDMRERVRDISLKENVKDGWMEMDQMCVLGERILSLIMDGYDGYAAEEKALVDAWSKIIMLNVSILMWMIWQNKIPTRDNLIK